MFLSTHHPIPFDDNELSEKWCFVMTKLGELITQGDLKIWCSFHNLDSLSTVVKSY